MRSPRFLQGSERPLPGGIIRARARLLAVVVPLALAPVLAVAANELDWAYPVPLKHPTHEDHVLKKVPDSTRSYAQVQIDNFFGAVDWFPDEHPLMPDVVAHGRQPAVWACGVCHLTSGNGHPESAGLAGQSVSYLHGQIQEFKEGHRNGSVLGGVMTRIAQGMSDDETRDASRYFAAIPASIWAQVIEADTVPKSYIGAGAMRFPDPGGGKEPLRGRIIALPQDAELAESRDPHSGFIYYVPVGSLAKGAALVAAGDRGKTIVCAACHGSALAGQGEAPAIAGRSPVYLFRQLNDIKTGARSGKAVALMRTVVEYLTTDDMVAISAYVGSLAP